MGAPRFVMDDFWPSDLFLGGIPGAWYDPTDLSTMFQDSTGTTPVTAVEQPVGLILDKSQGLAQGSQLVVNGDGTTLTGWTPVNDAGCTTAVSGGQFVLTAVAVGAARLRQTIAVTAGKTYAISVFINSPGNGGPTFELWGTNYGAGLLVSAPATYNGTFTAIVQATSASLYLQINAYTLVGTLTNYFDNVSIRELAGNHASQSTAASRPTYRARYNLLTFSEQFNNAAWVRAANVSVTPDAIVAPDGTTTADLVSATPGDGFIYQTTSTLIVGTTYTFSVWLRSNSPASFTVALQIYNGTDTAGAQLVTVTNTWQRFTITKTVNQTNAYLVIIGGTVSGSPTFDNESLYAWGAQLLTAADVTATGNAYQRIAAATVYDTAPIFRPYLAFDGVDDSLSTSAINFTATDKMTVFAGATKLSDAAVAVLAELTADWFTTNGSWVVTAPNSAAANYGNGSRGTFSVPLGSANTFAAPNTAVLTHQSDIAGDVLSLRRNQAQIASSSADQGAGTYANAAMGIGSRTTGIFRFNGRLYSLIVRGAASSVTEIADTELWVNARTGAF